jgi:exodeoxyribonuclease X
MTKREEFLNSLICLDFETTALDPESAEIIEQASVGYENGQWVILSEELHDCSLDKIDPETSACNHLTKKKIKDYPMFVAELWYPFTQSKRDIMCSHNAPFDLRMLKNYVSDDVYRGTEDRWFCTLRVAKKLFVNDPSFTQLNLQYLFYRLELEYDANLNPHRAGYDSYLTGLVLEVLLDEMESRGIIDTNKDYYSQIKEWLKAPVKIEIMPFGKHKGEKIEDVPLSYWKWAINNITRFDPESIEYDLDFSETVLNYLSDKF